MPEHPPARSTRFSALLDRITEGFLAIDDEWRIVECNGHAAALLGGERAELLGAELWAAAPNVVETTFADHYRRTMDDRDSTAFEAFWPHTETTYRVRVYPTDDGGIEVYLRDVDARLPARDGPRHATVVEAVTDGVLAIDEEDRVALVNDALTELLDAGRTTLLGTSLDALSTATKLTDDDVRRLRAAVEHVRDAGTEDHRIQLSLPDTEGRPGAVEVRLSPLPGEDDRVAAVVRDVTERRDRERVVVRCTLRRESCSARRTPSTPVPRRSTPARTCSTSRSAASGCSTRSETVSSPSPRPPAHTTPSAASPSSVTARGSPGMPSSARSRWSSTTSGGTARRTIRTRRSGAS